MACYLRGVFERLRQLLSRQPPLVRGTGSARPRTYSADSGYVYEYSFAGFRSSGDVYEYVFTVSGGRAPGRTVQVMLPAEAAEWTGRDRELSASERYGLAKVCLKNAMDRAAGPAVLEAVIRPGREEIAEVADLLDL